MKSNVVISGRGQLTLPSDLRKKYGLGEGSVVVIEDRDGEIILKPTAVLEVEYYPDSQIREWIEKDRLSGAREREALRARLKRLAKAK